jgi:hypothetical protein
LISPRRKRCAIRSGPINDTLTGRSVIAAAALYSSSTTFFFSFNRSTVARRVAIAGPAAS